MIKDIFKPVVHNKKRVNQKQLLSKLYIYNLLSN